MTTSNMHRVAPSYNGFIVTMEAKNKETKLVENSLAFNAEELPAEIINKLITFGLNCKLKTAASDFTKFGYEAQFNHYKETFALLAAGHWEKPRAKKAAIEPALIQLVCELKGNSYPVAERMLKEAGAEIRQKITEAHGERLAVIRAELANAASDENALAGLLGE